MSEDQYREPRRCECSACLERSDGDVAQRHRDVNRLLVSLDEQARRLFVAFLARQHGRGGVSLFSRVTGLSRNTIRLGIAQFDQPPRNDGRIRKKGGGRPSVEKKGPGIVGALIGLVEQDTAGDPMTDQKWTRKTTTALAGELKAQGFAVSPDTVGRLLRQRRYTLKSNRKRVSEGQDPDRDRQFRYLRRVRKLFVSKGLPVISVDAKKKELVGNFKNPGRRWRREHRDVKDHDFPSKALGRAIPYGIYDWAHNDGYVVVGKSHETSAFAVAAIRRWWLAVGQKRYPTAKALLIEADCGGGNDSRRWAWKLGLQSLADEFGLFILVTHYPPGASKWNPIEHRMFSLISINWAAEPLLSYEVILALIRDTTSSTGFRCEAYLDEQDYPTEAKVSKAQRATIRLERRPFLPRLNYAILPHEPPD